MLKALELDAQLRNQGFTIPQADPLIAAIAPTLDAPLLSRGIRHYERLRDYEFKVLAEL